MASGQDGEIEEVTDMAKVLVFHFTEQSWIPKFTPQESAEIIGRFYDVLKNYPDVKFNGAYADENGMGIGIWDAPNADLVKEVVMKVTGAPPKDPTIVIRRVL